MPDIQPSCPPSYDESLSQNPDAVVISLESKPNDRYVNTFWRIDTDIRNAFIGFAILNWLTTLPIMYLARCYGVFAIPFAYNLFVTVCATHNSLTCLRALKKISVAIHLLMWPVCFISTMVYSIMNRTISETALGWFLLSSVYFLFSLAALLKQIKFVDAVEALVMYERRHAQ